MRPIFISEPPFMQNLLNISHYFPKLLSFQANFRNFNIRLFELGLTPVLEQFEKHDTCLYSFCTEKRVIVIPGG